MKLLIRTRADLEAAQARTDAEASHARARAYLTTTDWVVTRRAETGVPIPEDILTQRAAAREILSTPLPEAPLAPEG
jgi:hypothetical protein